MGEWAQTTPSLVAENYQEEGNEREHHRPEYSIPHLIWLSGERRALDEDRRGAQMERALDVIGRRQGGCQRVPEERGDKHEPSNQQRGPHDPHFSLGGLNEHSRTSCPNKTHRRHTPD